MLPASFRTRNIPLAARFPGRSAAAGGRSTCGVKLCTVALVPALAGRNTMGRCVVAAVGNDLTDGFAGWETRWNV